MPRGRTYSREARKLQPFMAGVGGGVVNQMIGSANSEGPGIDLINTATNIQIGLGGDTILVYHADGSPVAEFAPTDAGLDEATATIASPYDKIVLPQNMVLTASHVLGGAIYEFPEEIEYSILLTLSANTRVRYLNLVHVLNQIDALIGVIGPSTGKAYLESGYVYIENAAGSAYGLSVTSNGDLECYNMRVRGISHFGFLGYAVYNDPACGGDVYFRGACAEALGSTNSFNQ